MSKRVVTTQAELDAALAEKVDWIEIRSERGVWLKVAGNRGNSSVEAWENSSVEARGNSSVVAWENSSVVAWGNSSVEAWENSSVEARGNSSVVAWENSSVEARGNSSVVAWGNSSVVAWGNSSVEAWENSSVEARGNSSVVARGNSSVVAWGNSSVEAWENSSVEAWENSSVVARGNSSVEAREASCVRVKGGKKITASAAVAVHLFDATVAVQGGVVIDVSKALADPAQWCEHHGVTVNAAGVATLYKAVDDQWTTGYGFDYSPGRKPSAPDWRDDNSCGGGLHFGPTPRHAREYQIGATRFVEVGVKVADLRPIPGGTAKCKAPKVVRACREVAIDGKRATS